ncbi:Phosphatidylserine decarboxylase proenzyme 3 [Trametes pubescens]|uniref:Phosphatidylserine decarboxylase proenzyme 3 n=1 Tax=Trametes pubescens TaxID=154538 RepID=A0A1M2VGV3_TRAPU|nr:Phosphatidylserine decarboxylase proenzyme 3 [Trametes pubescens]
MPAGIVRKLRNYLNDQCFVEIEFERAFKMAKASGTPLFKNWGIDTVEDFLNYYEKFVKWVPTEEKDGRYVYNHLCLFYFVLCQSPLLGAQSPILPTTHSPYTWLSQWVVDYAKEMGKWMDSTHSINKEAIASFGQAREYNMDDYEPVEWKTFNQFFARRLKPGRRPIDSPGDNTVIVSAADAKFDGWWPVDDVGICTIKGVPWSIRQLLDHDGSEHVKAGFAGGKFCHSFLAPKDYHRVHAPVSGTVLEATVIDGLCHLGVVYVPETDNKPAHLKMWRTMEPKDESLKLPNHAGYQFLQARALILIKNPVLGLVAVLPIGMAQVSSVVLSVRAGDNLEKGDEVAYFQLGGSDVVIVFQACANVSFDNTEKGKHYKFGQVLAVAQPNESNN